MCGAMVTLGAVSRLVAGGGSLFPRRPWRRPDFSFFQGFGQIRLVDDLAPAGVDDDHPLLHFGCAQGRSSRALMSSDPLASPGVRVHHDAHVTDSLLFPGVVVSPGARINRCIVDKNVVIPAGTRIGFDASAGAARFTISDHGIVVIEKDFVF